MGGGISAKDDNEADEGLSHADDHGVCMGLGFAVNSGIERIQS